jgi:CHAD domain-containing protein
LGVGLKPTAQQLEGLSRLRGSTDFERHQEVSREYERELTERLVNATDIVTIHETRGAIKALRALREFYESAPAGLTKMSGK